MQLRALPRKWSLKIGGDTKRLTLEQIVSLRDQAEIIIHDAAGYHPIVVLVANKLRISPELIMSRERSEPVAIARFLIYSLMHRRGLSFGAIGKIMQRDHAAIFYGIKSLKAKIETNKRLREELEAIETLANKTTL